MTADNSILIFGGYGDEVNWMRKYSHDNSSLTSQKMESGRW